MATLPEKNFSGTAFLGGSRSRDFSAAFMLRMEDWKAMAVVRMEMKLDGVPLLCRYWPVAPRIRCPGGTGQTVELIESFQIAWLPGVGVGVDLDLDVIRCRHAPFRRRR